MKKAKKKFYWISFQRTIRGHAETKGACSDVHPLAFAREWNTEADAYGFIVPLSWQEITAAEYRKYEDDWS